MAGGLGRPRPRRPGCATDGRARPRTVHRITRRLWRSAFASVGDAAGVQVKAMVYAFVALVDETLVFSAWPGQGAWQEKPLESHLYGSRQAGEYLPLAIKRLLDERAPASRDLANVYLQCLILGFRGRLRGPRGEALHEKWRQALFAFAWQARRTPPTSAVALSSLPPRRHGACRCARRCRTVSAWAWRCSAWCC
ncbi:DotU/TssL family secretion system protein [Pseudomonas aeruginosa]|nr:DotU/TssL family secretion system protein [Pseudomonas aeruginosa]